MSWVRSPWRALAVALVVLAVGATLAACGGSDQYAIPEIKTEAGKRGKAVALDQGCISCHTASGRQSTGPTWKNLAGSKVKLDSGETVIADDAYLTQSIRDPRSQVVAGYANIMPTTYADLSTREVADLVAYLRELSTSTR